MVAEKQIFFNQIKRVMVMVVLKVVLAIFVPPVAAFLQVAVSTHFWINIVLTIAGILPGQIHALWLVLNKQKA